MNNNTIKSIERVVESIVGLKIDKIRNMTLEEEREYVKNKTSKDLVFSRRKRKGIYGRGNPLLAKKKYRTIEYIDEKILDIERGNF